MVTTIDVLHHRLGCIPTSRRRSQFSVNSSWGFRCLSPFSFGEWDCWHLFWVENFIKRPVYFRFQGKSLYRRTRSTGSSYQWNWLVASSSTSSKKWYATFLWGINGLRLKLGSIWPSSPQEASTDPNWVLIPSPKPELAAQILLRGTCSVNIIMMASGEVDKRAFADQITGKILMIDQLQRLNFTSINTALSKKPFQG